MKRNAVSGCFTWIALLFVFGSFLLPASMFVGSMTSETNFAMNTMAKYMCPEGTTPQTSTSSVQKRGTDGKRYNDGIVELQCRNPDGSIVPNLSFLAGPAWIGVFILAGLLLAILFAFIFAVPGGILLNRMLEKMRGPKPLVSERKE